MASIYPGKNTKNAMGGKNTTGRIIIRFSGIIGLLAIGAMVFVGYHLNWHITWWYFVASIVAYSVAIVGLNITETNSLKLVLGCHFAFLFLVGGLYLNFQDLYINLGLFASAIAAGFALPFMWPNTFR